MIRIFRVLILGTALGVAACASDQEAARTTPPSPYEMLATGDPVGAAHGERPDGATEIFVRLNETSSRQRARNMAYYHAARLGRLREVEMFRVLSEEPGMECEASESDSLGVSGVGHPVVAAAVFVFVALYILVPKPETFDAFPTHTLNVAFGGEIGAREDLPPVSVPETLAALKPEFGAPFPPKGTSGADPADFTDAERELWARNAKANEEICADLEKAGKGVAKHDQPGDPANAAASEEDHRSGTSRRGP